MKRKESNVKTLEESFKEKGIKELGRLLQKSNLPIYFLVDSEVVCDDGYASWYGQYWFYDVRKLAFGHEQVHSIDDVCALETLKVEDITEDDMEALADIFDNSVYDMTDECIIGLAKSVVWTKCIVIGVRPLGD